MERRQKWIKPSKLGEFPESKVKLRKHFGSHTFQAINAVFSCTYFKESFEKVLVS